MLEKNIETIMAKLGVSRSVATELALLAGDDVDIAVQCSQVSAGLGECKARIIDARLRNLEEVLAYE